MDGSIKLLWIALSGAGEALEKHLQIINSLNFGSVWDNRKLDYETGERFPV